MQKKIEDYKFTGFYCYDGGVYANAKAAAVDGALKNCGEPNMDSSWSADTDLADAINSGMQAVDSGHNYKIVVCADNNNVEMCAWNYCQYMFCVTSFDASSAIHYIVDLKILDSIPLTYDAFCAGIGIQAYDGGAELGVSLALYEDYLVINSNGFSVEPVVDNFKESIFELAFGDDAINKEFSDVEVIAKVKDFSEKAWIYEDLSK